MKFFKTPKGYVMIALLLLAAISILMSKQSMRIKELQMIGFAVGTGIVFDFAVAIAKGYKKRIPDGAIVTALIVSMVLSPMTHWYVTMTTTLISLLSKHYLKNKRRPYFNPAAFGLLASILIFKSEQSWWGALPDAPIWCIPALLIVGYYVTDRVNKFPQTFSFLIIIVTIVSIIGVMGIGDGGSALRSPYINSTLFLAFFMLTDPPTSPAKYGEQVLFGLIAAISAGVTYILGGGLEYLLIGSLVANAWNTWNAKQKESTLQTNVKKAK